MELAPIVLFVYNRPNHTLQTLNALAENTLATQSSLYIFADGLKNDATKEEKSNWLETNQLIQKVKGFKKVTVIQAQQNLGLANSIIQGITRIIDQHQRIIVLEDDLITSPHFLTFMNDALQKYIDAPQVYAISGYQFPIHLSNQQDDAFFFNAISSWGWATWKDRWDQFDPEAKGWEEMQNNKKLRKAFDFNHSIPYYDMLYHQMVTKKINSWAIRWYWSVFKNKGLVLYPTQTLVDNIGFDGSGTHDGRDNIYKSLINKEFSPNQLPNKIVVHTQNSKTITKYWKVKHFGNRWTRFKTLVKNIIPVT